MTGLSSVVMKLIPRSVKLATIVGMGLQIALVGMTSIKLVVPNDQTIVGLGDIHSPDILLSIFGLVLIGSLLFHQVRGGILIGIFVMTLIDWVMKGDFPTQFIQFPDLNIQVTEFISLESFSFGRCFAGVMAFLFIGVIDVSGVIFGMASLAKLTEPDGHIPGATPTFVAVAIGTIVSAATGGTPVIVYVESAAGIKEGGRTGLTAVMISGYFLLSLFFAPVLSQIPLIATSPVAILVGAMMMSQSVEIDWDNMSEAIPAFLTLVTMPFTFSITNGIVLGLVTALMFYITTGQAFTDAKIVFAGSSAGGTVGIGGGESELVPLHSPSNSNNSRPATIVFSSETPSYGAAPHHSSQNHAPTQINYHGAEIHYTRSNSGGGSGTGGLVPECHSFLDETPYVRSPSLILGRRDAEAVRHAKGRSLSQDEGGYTVPNGARRDSYTHSPPSNA